MARLEERGVVECTEGEAMGLRYEGYGCSYDQGGDDWDCRGSVGTPETGRESKMLEYAQHLVIWLLMYLTHHEFGSLG